MRFVVYSNRLVSCGAYGEDEQCLTPCATAPDPTKLAVPMLQRFMAMDKAFRKARAQFSAAAAMGASTFARRLTCYWWRDNRAFAAG